MNICKGHIRSYINDHITKISHLCLWLCRACARQRPPVLHKSSVTLKNSHFSSTLRLFSSLVATLCLCRDILISRSHGAPVQCELLWYGNHNGWCATYHIRDTANTTISTWYRDAIHRRNGVCNQHIVTVRKYTWKLS